MFLENKYSRWYFSLMEKAKTRTLKGYIEKHHVLPHSMGGERKAYNLVKLTAREHFIAHCLLARCVTQPYVSKMWNAVWMMRVNPSTQQRYVNSRQIELARIEVAKFISKLHTGKTFNHKESTKEKLKAARATQIISKESYEKQAKTLSTLVWMNDGVRSYRVKPEMVQGKLNDGLTEGRLMDFMTEDYKKQRSIKASKQWAAVKATGHTGHLVSV